MATSPVMRSLHNSLFHNRDMLVPSGEEVWEKTVTMIKTFAEKDNVSVIFFSISGDFKTNRSAGLD